uniref:Aromatic-L-amino-acid decarboxylase n=1 Tax=Ditylenchus dipsaci TaxID=166011 RepID=A0A915DPN3_9BILA
MIMLIRGSTRQFKELSEELNYIWTQKLFGSNASRHSKALPDVKPGFIWDLLPKEAPQEPEKWEQIFKDVEPVVLSSNTNWHHPNFFAYYPTACSYPAIMGDILSGGLASIGFTWKSSPSMTELEMAMTDWLARAFGLPDIFLNSDPGPGAGIIQSTASDATLVALLSARARAVSLAKAAEKTSTSTNWLQSSLDKALNKINVSKDAVQKHLSLLNNQNNQNTEEQDHPQSAVKMK